MTQTLVTGCARSGTRYMAQGLGLGHEVLGENGISSWLMAACEHEYFALPWPRNHGIVSLDWAPDDVIHVVRDPVKTIASVAGVMRHGWLAWAQQYVAISYPVSAMLPDDEWRKPAVLEGRDMLRMAMAYWLQWTELIEDTWPDRRVVRVEDQMYDNVSKTTNTRPHEQLEWRDLYAAGGLLARDVEVVAYAYGYRRPELA